MMLKITLLVVAIWIYLFLFIYSGSKYYFDFNHKIRTSLLILVFLPIFLIISISVLSFMLITCTLGIITFPIYKFLRKNNPFFKLNTAIILILDDYYSYYVFSIDICNTLSTIDGSKNYMDEKNIDFLISYLFSLDYYAKEIDERKEKLEDFLSYYNNSYSINEWIEIDSERLMMK